MVLLLPPPGDPLGLLAPSPGGGTVPTAYLVPGRGWVLAAALSSPGGVRPARLFDPRALHVGGDPIHVEAGAGPVAYDREHVLVLSDWSFMHPHEILSKLKKSPGYFNQSRTTLSGLMLRYLTPSSGV